MITLVLSATLLLALGKAQLPAQCVASDSAPVLDHVVVAVRNLDSTTNVVRRMGFRVKPGRLHPNNLLNNHVKFREGSEVELMTLRGAATDEMSRGYESILATGSAGAYVAFTVRDIAMPSSAAAQLGLSAINSSSGAWRFVSFRAESPAAAIFFGAGNFVAQDADSVFAHTNGAVSLEEAWLEGGSQVASLLERLGARRCGAAISPIGEQGERWALRRGSVVIVPPQPGVRPRVRGLILRRDTPRDTLLFPISNFWMQLRGSAASTPSDYQPFPVNR